MGLRVRIISQYEEFWMVSCRNHIKSFGAHCLIRYAPYHPPNGIITTEISKFQQHYQRVEKWALEEPGFHAIAAHSYHNCLHQIITRRWSSGYDICGQTFNLSIMSCSQKSRNCPERMPWMKENQQIQMMLASQNSHMVNTKSQAVKIKCKPFTIYIYKTTA